MLGDVILTEGVYACMECGTGVRKEDAMWTFEFWDATEEVANPLCPACVYEDLKGPLVEEVEDELEGSWGADGAGMALRFWLDEYALYFENPAVDPRLTELVEELWQRIEAHSDVSEAMSVERILEQPRSGSTCLSCGGRLGLHLVQGAYVSLCAPCTKTRIETFESFEPDDKPWWVEDLYDEVLGRIELEERRSRKAHTMSWDLVKCSQCGRMIELNGAQYRREGAASGERSKWTLTPATRFLDGAVIDFPPDGLPEIHHPVCITCGGRLKFFPAEDLRGH